MPILIVFLILSIVYPLLYLRDIRIRSKPDVDVKQSPLTSDSVVLFAPFITLFYHDNFWPALLYYFLPFFGYCAVVTFAIQRWKKVDAQLQMIAIHGVGSVILTLVAYYLFFHEGTLADEPVATQSDTHTSHWWQWWPFVVVVLTAWLTVKLNSEKWIWFLGIAFLVLPFFSHHPLWLMLLTSLAFLQVTFSLAQKQGSGAYVAFFMFYMMAQVATLILYAVLF